MRLAVALYTYNRQQYAVRTLETALRHLRWSGELRVHIADDGSPDGYLIPLLEVATQYTESVTLSDAQRGGYGKSINLSMQALHNWADYILMLEDDWECLREYDADMLVQGMRETGIGCLRLGYIGFTQSLVAKFVRWSQGCWLEFDPYSPEPHVFAGHPRIESVPWQRVLGPWPEGLPAQESEFEVAHRMHARQFVGWPIDYVSPHGNLFSHIGTNRAE